jgi:hypothetical protein
MSSRNHLLTATELAEALPPVLFLIVEGYLEPIFPGATRAAPALTVVLHGKKAVPDDVPFVDRFDGTQWNDVAVPLLREIQTWGWLSKRSTVQETVVLLADIYGPEGSVVFEEGDEWGSLQFSTQATTSVYGAQEYMLWIGGFVKLTATEAGY